MFRFAGINQERWRCLMSVNDQRIKKVKVCTLMLYHTISFYELLCHHPARIFSPRSCHFPSIIKSLDAKLEHRFDGDYVRIYQGNYNIVTEGKSVHHEIRFEVNYARQLLHLNAFVKQCWLKNQYLCNGKLTRHVHDTTFWKSHVG